MKAPFPPNETRRLAALHGYHVLDTLPERAFDDLTLLAAQICQAPIALVSLVDENRQWFKSALGLSATETSRDLAFCAHAILYSDEVLEVRDAQLDPRFADNPLVTADPHIRFYAGAPLVTSDGLALGTLCVIDRVPRVLSAEQRTALRALSHTVIAQLELRRTVAAYHRTQEQLQSLNASLEQQVEARTAELQRELEVRRESEQKFSQLTENIREVFWITDPVKENILYISPGYELIWGRTVQSLCDSPQSWLEAIHGEDRQRVRQAALTKQLAGLYDEEYRIVHPNGDVRWIHDKAFPIRDTGGVVYRIVGVAEDITERKQAETTLQEREKQFLALSTMSSDWFWQQDEEFRFTGFTGAFARDFTPPANTLGKTRWELNIDLTPEQWAAHRAILDAHLPFKDFEYPISDTGGEVRWYSINGEPVFDKDNRFTGYHGTGRNITEKKRVEESLRIAAIAFESQQGMMITDANKVILRVNRAFTEITGYAAEEAVGQTPRLLQSGRHNQDFYRAMWETIRRTGAWQGEIWDRRKNGEIYPKLLTIAAVKTDGGVVTHYVGVHTDISEHKQAEEALRNKGHLLSESQRIGHLGSWHLDLSTHQLTWSDETYRIYGVSPDTFTLNVESFVNLIHSDDRAAMQAWIADCMADEKHDELEFRINRPDGTVRILSGYGELQHDAGGRPKNLIGIVHDVTARKAAEEQIAFLAYRDALTGLPNRALLKDRATHTISMVQRAAEPMTMMLVGIDHLKAVNDTLGHDIGDELLVEMAERLRDSVRDQDTVARLSGKEFVLVLPGTATNGAALLASELLWKLAQPYQLGGHELTMTASIGIASYPDNGSDFDSLFKAVEIALHRVQTSKRNTFQFYNADMYQEMLARDHMVKALRNATVLDQLQLVYQPLVDLQTGQISGLEALLRWQHPELGAVSPAQFIPLAEESDLIKGIGEWVLRRACRDIRTWLDKGIKVPHVAVNVSPVQFHDPDLIAQVKSALFDFRVDPSLVYLEVTESALMDDVPRSEAMLKELKGLGVKLSLDDFGTGYSSLSYLKRFPFDKVKIDQSFVRDITISQSDNVIVKVIVSMAHGLGLKVIAEGVETEAQCEIMRTSVCDEIQGYFFSRPISAQAIEELFSEGRQLPPHLLRLQKPQRTLLLVDDEPNIVASLKRLFRRDGHVILTANSGPEGLDVLSRHKVDVIISDQRMPGMTGVEFLRAAKVNYPDTIRIVLSGYTELQSVTDAINEGAVYRFLTKPWEDEQLREQINKAFEHKELQEENRQLDIRIRSTNQELVAANRQLGEVLQETRHQIERDETSLAIVREALQHIPLPVIGVDDEGLMAFVNAAAQRLFVREGPLLGVELAYALPAIDAAIAAAAEGVPCELLIDRTKYLVKWNTMGANSHSRGKMVTLTKVALSS